MTLALPGDADAVLDHEIRRALRRDGRLSWHERNAQTAGQVCAFLKRKYPFWKCSWSDPCFYCEEI